MTSLRSQLNEIFLSYPNVTWSQPPQGIFSSLLLLDSCGTPLAAMMYFAQLTAPGPELDTVSEDTEKG